jgi:hypothetical protein
MSDGMVNGTSTGLDTVGGVEFRLFTGLSFDVVGGALERS